MGGLMGGLPSIDTRYALAVRHRTLIDETTFVHAKPTSRQVHLVEIAVIVRHHDHRYARLMQCRQQIEVEFAPKVRILISSPFIQQQDRTLLQQAHDQGEALALARRQVDGVKVPVREVGLVQQSKLRQQPIDFDGVRIGDPIESLEEMIVDKYRRDQLAIIFTRGIADKDTVEKNPARIWFVEAGEQLEESGFSRTVAAGDEDELARPQGKVHGPHLEYGLSRLLDVAEDDVVHLD